MRVNTAQLLALLICIGLLAASSVLTPLVNQGRTSLNMIGSESPEAAAPPEYAFAIQAFGAFRGLITNIAFIRAEEYKQEGRYYDAYQLASWICKLQPRFPSVWEFHAWNMAWNISVTTYTPEERWNWVYNGVKLLRDEGIRYNPRAVNLYRQLAWIFVNKMSESVDDYHDAYKRNWAWRMHLVLGPPPDPLGEYRPGAEFHPLDGKIGQDPLAEAIRFEAERRARDKGIEDALKQVLESTGATAPQPATELTPAEIVKRAAYAKVKAVADAPATLEELYRQQPEARQIVRELRELGLKITDDELNEDSYWQERGLAFTFFYRCRVLTDPPSMLAQVLKDPRHDEDRRTLERFDQIVGVRAKKPAGEALVRFLQKKVLKEVYKLDAGRMAELMALFGPIDWRVVDAHALYWVNEGLIAGKETIHNFKNDKLNTARLIFFSLRNLFNRNRMVFEPYTRDVNLSYINFNPDLNFIEPMQQAFLTYGRMLDPGAETGGAGDIFQAGHANFLAEAIRLLYFAGREAEAAKYYQYLRDTYGIQADGKVNPAYDRPLDKFAQETFVENLDTFRDARLALNGVLYGAFTQLAGDDRPRYAQLLSFARRVYDQYQSERERIEKLSLPPWDELRADVLLNWFREPAVSEFVTVMKSRLWRNPLLPNDLKLAVYDDLLEVFQHECDAVGFDASKAFPPPPGLEQYRAERGRRGPQEKEKKAETPAQQIE